MFSNLCREGEFKHVVVLTTFWDDVTNEAGTKRERRLKSKFFQELVQGGARFMRHNGSSGSAQKVLKHILTLRSIEFVSPVIPSISMSQSQSNKTGKIRKTMSQKMTTLRKTVILKMKMKF